MIIGQIHIFKVKNAKIKNLSLTVVKNVLTSSGFLEYFGLAALPAIRSRAYLAWRLAELGACAEGSATGEERVRQWFPLIAAN